MTAKPVVRVLLGGTLTLTVLTFSVLTHALPALRPDWPQLAWLYQQLVNHFLADLLSAVASLIGGALALAVLLRGMIYVHEWVHGAAFWVFARVRPDYGSLGGYAFCAIPPGRFLSRNLYIAALLAPLLIVTGFAIVLLTFAPLAFVPLFALLLILHTAASVGDLWLAGTLLLAHSPAIYVWDAGTTIILYQAKSKH